jgi:hypothetical protein
LGNESGVYFFRNEAEEVRKVGMEEGLKYVQKDTLFILDLYAGVFDQSPCFIVPLDRQPIVRQMKFIILLIGVYLFYRYFLQPPAPLPPPQEPDLFIDHEEVKRENEKNK